MKYTLFFGTIVAIAMITSCGTGSQTSADTELLAGSPAESFTLDLTKYAPPGTDSLAKYLDTNPYVWDMFSWQTFVALNWPAVQPDSTNGYLRGFPDTGKSFGDEASEAVVWETFKEKREMFKHGADSVASVPDPWSSDYSNEVKYVYGTGKFSTLDETVQVKSEATEPYYNDDTQAPITARVFRGTQPRLFGEYTGGGAVDTTKQGPGNAVRYEVKVNYDFYNYVVSKGLYYDPYTQKYIAKNGPVQLPWRTSKDSLTGGNPNRNMNEVLGYSESATMTAYQNPANGANPPLLGSVHIKAAWAPITKAEQGRFLSRSSEYFYTDTSQQTDTAQALFGLVGLHIIQRIKLEPNNAVGGAFIFATWEHKDIRDTITNTTYPFDGSSVNTSQYTYTNYFPAGIGPSAPNPKLDDPFQVARVYPILQHTQQANTQVSAMLGDSFWANYRLVGTQFMPVDLKTDNTVMQDTAVAAGNRGPFKPSDPSANNASGQPVFLSNLVIETNTGLQQFQGIPPLVNVISNYSEVPSNPGFTFNRLGDNVAYDRGGHNTGGCMGCHGVAQLNGYSFSFVLLGGQAGADPDTEKDFLPPLTSRTTTSSISKPELLEMIEKNNEAVASRDE